jgi:preprotein translocase subunit YajC
MNLIDFLLLAQATEPVAPPSWAQTMNGMLIPVLMIVVFYYLLIRPQQKKAKDQAKLVAALETGDRVVTSAGIHGVITNLKDRTVMVRVADNIKLEFDRGSIVTVVKDGKEVGEKAS